MSNRNFFDSQLHQVIKRQPGEIRIRIFIDEHQTSHQRQTKFFIGDHLLGADTNPDDLFHYLLKPLLAHYPHEVTVNDRPITRQPFQPTVQHYHQTLPRPLEEQYRPRDADFTQHNNVGVIIDGVTYLPQHASWDYNVLDPHPTYPHWTGVTNVSVYPFVDLGSPTHSDPSQPENVAEVLSRTLELSSQLPNWMRRSRVPNDANVHQSWAPQTTKLTTWLAPSLPITPHATPALIAIADTALAFTIAHALYNHPELGLVPVLAARPGHEAVTITCPDPTDVRTTDQNGLTRYGASYLPEPDGPLARITINCQRDGEPLRVPCDALFLTRGAKNLVYAAAPSLRYRPKLQDSDLAFMAANAFIDENPNPALPAQFFRPAIQALTSARQAHRDYIIAKIDELQGSQSQLTPLDEPLQVTSGAWTVTLTPDNQQNPD